LGELSISVEYITLELCTSIEYIALELCTSVEYETLELSTHAKSVEYIYRVHYKSLVHSFEEFEYISIEHYISTKKIRINRKRTFKKYLCIYNTTTTTRYSLSICKYTAIFLKMPIFLYSCSADREYFNILSLHFLKNNLVNISSYYYKDEKATPPPWKRKESCL